MKRILSFGFLALIALVALSTGAVVAQESNTTVIDESVTVDNDTEAVWYEVVAADDLNGSTLNASVTFEGLEEGQSAGNGTELSNSSFEITTAGESKTGEYELVDGDATDYEKIHITVEGDTETDAELVASSDYGTTQQISGGGGGGLLSGVSGSSGGILAIVALLGIGYVVRD